MPKDTFLEIASEITVETFQLPQHSVKALIVQHILVALRCFQK